MRYRQKPVVIDAEQFLPPENGDEWRAFGLPWMVHRDAEAPYAILGSFGQTVIVWNGDWVIRDANGRFSRSGAKEFTATYEAVPNGT